VYEDYLPERLARLRTQKGVSARDMSLSLGQADNYINNIENRRSMPSMSAFFYICEYLHITPKDFFDEENPSPYLLNELTKELKHLDGKALSHMLGLVRELRGK